MKSTQNRKQTSWTCTGAIGKSTGCTCRCHHRIAGKIQLCEAGGKIDYLLCISLAQQLLPFGLLECDSGSWFNCDLHLKYRNYIHIPVTTCVSIPTAVGGASCINLPSNFHSTLPSTSIYMYV